MTRQKLSIDLDSLFPGTAITIGNQSIVIRPLSIEQLSVLSKKATSLGSVLAEKDITWENFNNPKNLVSIAIILLENAPDILEEASNIEVDDLKRLPLEIIMNIVDAIITENMKSKEGMEKNFKSLTKKFLKAEPEKKEGVKTSTKRKRI